MFDSQPTNHKLVLTLKQIESCLFMLNACAGLTPNTSKHLFCLALAPPSILCLPQGNCPAVGVFLFPPPHSTAEKKSLAAQDSRSYLQVRERHLKNNHPFSSVGYPLFPQGPLGTKWGGRTTLAHQEEVDLLKTVIPLPRLPPPPTTRSPPLPSPEMQMLNSVPSSDS